MVEMSAESAATFPADRAPELDVARLGLSLLDRVGNTPLLRFDRLTAHLPGVTLLGKAEWHNPGGSVKDRAASRIVVEGRRSGKFSPGKSLLDATSGNTGIAYAMLGAAERFPVTLCMPTNVSVERKQILGAYGANIVYTDPGEGSDGAIRMAREAGQMNPQADASSAVQGYFVIAMGKLGAFELNYSSDIDIIVFWFAGGITCRDIRVSNCEPDTGQII